MVAATLQTTLASRLRFLGAAYLSPRNAPDARAVAEFRRLFGAPAPACPPIQSSALEEAAACEADALAWYRRFGHADLAGATRADHVGVLLTFAGHLLDADPDAGLLRDFADSHLAWIRGFSDRLVAESRHSFYAELGYATRASLESYFHEIG